MASGAYTNIHKRIHTHTHTHTHVRTHTHTHTHTHAHTHTFVDESDYKKPGAHWPQTGACLV